MRNHVPLVPFILDLRFCVIVITAIDQRLRECFPPTSKTSKQCAEGFRCSAALVRCCLVPVSSWEPEKRPDESHLDGCVRRVLADLETLFPAALHAIDHVSHASSMMAALKSILESIAHTGRRDTLLTEGFRNALLGFIEKASNSNKQSSWRYPTVTVQMDELKKVIKDVTPGLRVGTGETSAVAPLDLDVRRL